MYENSAHRTLLRFSCVELLDENPHPHGYRKVRVSGKQGNLSIVTRCFRNTARMIRLTFYGGDRQIRMRAHQLVSALDMAKSKRVSPNRNIPQDVKNAVWKRDGRQCVMCGSNKDLQYDHIIPLSLGGGNQVENIQLLCKDCNLTKSNKIM